MHRHRRWGLGAGPCRTHLPLGAERGGDSAAPASATGRLSRAASRHPPPPYSRRTSTPRRPPSLSAWSVRPSARSEPPRLALLTRRRRRDPPPRAMEPAAGSERRSAPGPAVPPPPRGRAPLAAAPGPGPLSSPAREPPQSEEERQLRISESGQFSDGLEDRGERAPPWAPSPGRSLPRPGGAVRSAAPGPPLPARGLGRAGRGLAPRRARGRGAGTSPRRHGERRAAAPPPAAAAPSPEPEKRAATWATPPLGPRPPPRQPPVLRRPLEKFAGGVLLLSSRALPGDGRSCSPRRDLSSVHPPSRAPCDPRWLPGRTSHGGFSFEEFTRRPPGCPPRRRGVERPPTLPYRGPS